jgi:hypothetical protein
MRILLVLLAVIVFGTMLLVDTAELVRLAASCVTGGCGCVHCGLLSGVGDS